MNNEPDQLDHLLLAYIDGKLNAAEREAVENKLAADAAVQQRYQQLLTVTQAMEASPTLHPPDRMKETFQQFLNKEKQKQSRVVSFSTVWYRVAAAVALLLVGGGAGYLITQQAQHRSELEALQREMALTRQLILSQIADAQSPSQRIIGIKSAYETTATAPADDIIRALIQTMNEDPNTNVRLAAVEALKRFNQNPVVRQALIQSLRSQSDPVVQLQLIQIMVEWKEKEAIKTMEQLIEDENVLPVVKDEAHAGIFRLS